MMAFRVVQYGDEIACELVLAWMLGAKLLIIAFKAVQSAIVYSRLRYAKDIQLLVNACGARVHCLTQLRAWRFLRAVGIGIF